MVPHPFHVFVGRLIFGQKNKKVRTVPKLRILYDVISTAVATGVLDSGTAGSALRGGVVA